MANQQFGKIVRAVRAGRTVVLTDRGKPLAEIKPLRDPQEATLAALEAEGMLRRASRPGALQMGAWKPLAIRGKALSQTISEDREERN